MRTIQAFEDAEGFFNADNHLVDCILQGAIGFLGEASIAGGIAGEGGAGSEERGGENGGVMMCFMIDPFSWLVSLLAFCLMPLPTPGGWGFFQGMEGFFIFLGLPLERTCFWGILNQGNRAGLWLPQLFPLNPPLIPDYRLLLKIGEGAFGQIWMGRDALGLHRAIKVFGTKISNHWNRIRLNIMASAITRRFRTSTRACWKFIMWESKKRRGITTT